MYNAYSENKRKYSDLCEYSLNIIQGGSGTKDSRKMYILHSTNLENLVDMLLNGSIYANKYIDKNRRRMSGDIESKYVFANVIMNGQSVPNFGIGLILSEDLLKKKTFIFNKGWIAAKNKHSIVVRSNDSAKKKELKMCMIKDNVSGTKTLMDHEILFKHKINNLKEYLIGIYCPDCGESDQNKIKDVLKKQGFKVKIYTETTTPEI